MDPPPISTVSRRYVCNILTLTLSHLGQEHCSIVIDLLRCDLDVEQYHQLLVIIWILSTDFHRVEALRLSIFNNRYHLGQERLISCELLAFFISVPGGWHKDTFYNKREERLLYKLHISLGLVLTFRVTHTHTVAHPQTRSLTLTFGLTLTHSHTHSHSFTHSLSLTHTLTLTHSHTHFKLTHTLTYVCLLVRARRLLQFRFCQKMCDLLQLVLQKTFAHLFYNALDPWSFSIVGHGRPQNSPLVLRSHQNDAQGHECTLTFVYMYFQ